MTPLELFQAKLRFGNYTQTFHVLKRDGAFSAAGLACETFREETKTGTWDGDDFVLNGHRSSVLLPAAVAKWLGFPSTDPTLKVSIKYKDLRPENDALTRNALEAAEREKDSVGALRKAKADREFWEEIRDTTYEGEETFLSLNCVLMMRFDQIASVLSRQ